MASPLVVGFLFSPRLLNHDVGNENITIRDSWGIYFSPFAASPLIEKNPIPTSPQMRIITVLKILMFVNHSAAFETKSLFSLVFFLSFQIVKKSTWETLKEYAN